MRISLYVTESTPNANVEQQRSPAAVCICDNDSAAKMRSLNLLQHPRSPQRPPQLRTAIHSHRPSLSPLARVPGISTAARGLEQTRYLIVSSSLDRYIHQPVAYTSTLALPSSDSDVNQTQLPPPQSPKPPDSDQTLRKRHFESRTSSLAPRSVR